ncbi:MAG: penicillin-binding protein 2 [Patescibacteria group bacterium]|nr:penicillin-binding protein 2 [Patescibacteria group bacterium]
MTWRYRFTFLILVLFYLLVIGRLFYWQVVKAQELSTLGQLQYGTTVTVFPKRGEIRSSDGFPIVTNKISYLVFANPKEVKDKSKTISLLSQTLSLDVASVSASLALDKFWVPLTSGIDTKVKAKLEALNLQGIGFEQQYSRFYPEASLAAQLVGFVGKDEAGEDKGYFGLEGYYNRLLKGKVGSAIQIHDAFGKPILARLNEQSGQVDGSSLILSLNRPIQFLVERVLKESVDKFGATSGMVGVMNPKTGEILAMASYPTFDPRSYQDYSENFYKNAFISDTYEPGSTFKPLVMSAALDAKLVTPQTKCTICSGPVSIGGYELHTWDDKYFKNTTMTEVIQHSDNTGMVFVAQKLGVARMINYLEKFGIGNTTGVDLQGEVSAALKPENQWYAVDLATMGFGQGISVTPMELLTAISAIANNGKRMEPHVVSAVENPDGVLVKIPPRLVDTPISPETAKVMAEIMVNAVNKGEASWTKLDGYRVAGKTGTASIPVNGHYDPTKTIASFVGFAPADDPKFSMIVILNKPTASIYGAETAAPIFFEIAKNILSYYGIPPSGQ